MSSFETGSEAAPIEDQSHSAQLFPSDSGELPVETRRALVQLLAGPSLDARRHSHLWSVLVRDEAPIRKRLSELFLDLVMDRDLQVAFTRGAETGELDAPVLLRRAQLTFLDSVLLLHLRQRLTQADAQGERAVVAQDELLDHLRLYEQSASTDRAGFSKKVRSSIEKIKEHSILLKIRSSEDRFEISPTLKLMFSAEEIQALSGLYQRMASQEQIAEEQEDTEA